MSGGWRRPSRRGFGRGLGVAALALLAGCDRLPFQAPAAKVPRIGYLVSSGPTDLVTQTQLAVFQEGLRELGYVEGRTILIERRYADGKPDRLPGLAGELAGLPVDLIVAVGTLAIRRSRDATGTIPIVMLLANDPEEAGLVASLARPGGNVTGLSQLSTPLIGKRLQLLSETVPGASRVALLWDSALPDRGHELGVTELSGRALGLQVQALDVRSADAFESALDAAAQEHADALMVQTNFLTNANHARIAELALRRRLPTMGGFMDFPEQGGLMAYGLNQPDQFRRGAFYVDKILKGARPADLPVEQPTKFDFVINLKTAAALGLAVPRDVLVQATEVIQ